MRTRQLTHVLLTACLCAGPAQERLPGQDQPPLVGVFLWHDSPNDLMTLAGVRAGLADAGVAVRMLERQADSDPDVARAQLAELQDRGCALVLALGTRATQLAREHLDDDVPIVFAAVTNPVTAGIVPDWQHPAPGLYGASNWIDPQAVIDVFRLAVPGLTDLGMLRSRENGVVSAAELLGMREYLRRDDAPKVTVHEVVVEDERDLPRAARELAERGVDAIWIPIDLTVYSNVTAVERGLGNARIPLLTTAAAGVRNGALVAAAVDYRLHGRRAAALVLRVLRDGRLPDERPVDRMLSSLVVVNLKAAQRVGVELPLSLLALADELIAPNSDNSEPR